MYDGAADVAQADKATKQSATSIFCIKKHSVFISSLNILSELISFLIKSVNTPKHCYKIKKNTEKNRKKILPSISSTDRLTQSIINKKNEMNNFLQSLLERKQAAEAQKKLAQKEIEFIDRVISEYQAEKKGDKPPPLTSKALNSLYLKNLTRELLTNHDSGLATKELHNLAMVFSEIEINYNTFRTYLTEMSNNGAIKQDNNRKWHLNN